ncbi:AraC family transcriptional regulator [Aureivirga sp. CE67]|uniref:AraC family transcriptional regulator n=1 Tax=Aureivirga sp. CE67 TaxID=1788983 RepID=UPI0018C91F5C|nr:helix-turn-helix domain-containing protein [Aureivirga sp. CE67]
MKEIVHIKSVSQLAKTTGLKAAHHPLIFVLDLAEVTLSDEMIQKKIVSDLYVISLKTKSPKGFTYGRSFIDFSEGSLYGIAPGQTLEYDKPSRKGDFEGWAIYFHPSLLYKSNLMEKINEYAFFDYETNEALHLSEKEKNNISSIMEKIKEESELNTDEFSNELLVSNIELLLNYIKRYYSRQFLTRSSISKDVVSTFEKELKNYFNSKKIEEDGIPNVGYFSNKMNLSSSYLSDLLKKETGKNIQEYIHLQIIEKAKYLLLNSNNSVAEIAYQLGFEYPPYFSRLFKKKIGVTPSKFRESLN